MVQNGESETIVLVFTNEGTPATGLSPLMYQYVDITVPSVTIALTTLAITELGNGQYIFRPSAQTNKTFAFKVDAGATLGDADRYVDGVITWGDYQGDISNLANLDVKVSTRQPIKFTPAPNNAAIVAILDKVKQLTFDDDDNVYSHPDTEVTIPQNTDKIVLDNILQELNALKDDVNKEPEVRVEYIDNTADINKLESILELYSNKFKDIDTRMMYLKADLLDSNDDINNKIKSLLDNLSGVATKDDIIALLNSVSTDAAPIISEMETVAIIDDDILGINSELNKKSIKEILKSDTPIPINIDDLFIESEQENIDIDTDQNTDDIFGISEHLEG